MPSKNITDAFVRNVKPPKRTVVVGKDGAEKKTSPQVTYIDTLQRGLALTLSVSYGGTKTFSVLTYENTKPRTRKLGTYPQMTVKEARAKARAFFEDPTKFIAQSTPDTFKDVAEHWFRRHVVGSGLISHREIRRQLEAYVYKHWAGRRFLDIRRSQVNELLDQIADNHGASQADAVLATLRSMMTWYQSRDEHYTSPIVKGMKRDARKPGDRSRKRILSPDEIRLVWHAVTEMNGSFGGLVKMLLLTAQRREKVATMRFEDVIDGIWVIRQADREKGTGRSLKLPQIAIDIIDAQPRISGNPFVFSGRGAVAFNAFSDRKEELDKRLPGVPHWTFHDLRRTAKSLMARAGVLPHVSERVLGHAIAGVEGVYDQHSYDDEKADALLKLEATVLRIVQPSTVGNVVPLRG